MIRSSFSENSVFKLLILVFFLTAVFNYFYSGVFQARSGRKTDFDPYYTGAFCLSNNINPYNIDTLLETSKILGAQKNENAINKCVYPPFYMQLLKPLLFFNVQTARILWVCVINFLLIILSALLLYKLLNDFYVTAFAFSLFLFFKPLYITLALGQVNILIFFLLFLAFFSLQNKWNVVFAIAIAIASLIKIFPAAIYLYLLIRKKYKLFFISICALFLIAGFSVSLNYNDYIEYFTKTLPQFSLGAGGENMYNISVDGFIKKHKLPDFCNLIFMFLLFVAFIWKIRENSGDYSEISDNYFFGLFISISLLIPKTLWEHHLIILICALFIIIFEIARNNIEFRNSFWMILFGISFAIIANNFKYFDSRLDNFPLSLIRYLKLYALFLFNLVYFFGLKLKQ